MKGLVLFSDGSYALKEVPQPEIGRNVYAPHDVLIEVGYCGICGSDVHKWKDSNKKGVSSPTSAVVTGHEIVGTVKAVGPEVADVKVGDRVACELVTFYCGRCINCQTGRINICCNMPSMDQRAHYVTGGGYARYTMWPAGHVHVLPPSISLEEGTLLEPTAGSVHSMIERMKVQAGESVIILGPGARGLILLQIAKACGASPVVITGLSRDERTRLAIFAYNAQNPSKTVHLGRFLIVHEHDGRIDLALDSASMRVWTRATLGDALTKSGFRPVEWHGDLRLGTKYRPRKSPRLVAVAVRT